MQLQETRVRRGALVEICHQIPGRTRLRVPALRESRHLEGQIAAAFAALDGVHRVRLNRACVSVVLEHRADVMPTHEHLRHAVRPVLRPGAALVPAGSKRKPGPEKPKASAGAQSKRAAPPRAVSCPICQLKLKAARWILGDVWRCWRDHWTQRLHGRLIASIALFRP